MIERRQNPRGRTYFVGRIVFNDRWSTTDCRVRNCSARGARLQFDGLAISPEDVDLMVAGKGESRAARIVWRDKNEAGIEFTASPLESYVSVEAAQRIRKLEQERAALTRRVAQLTEATI